jgi:hypothetical protein
MFISVLLLEAFVVFNGNQSHRKALEIVERCNQLHNKYTSEILIKKKKNYYSSKKEEKEKYKPKNSVKLKKKKKRTSVRQHSKHKEI